ncbi:MAG: hypothetical protein IKE60_26460 [Reyranella sp.]|uniref:hypothetical protein n=1 Tax=Reyranella sp. TaxID=1929291 RepID=UPI0025FFF5B3|nr:hypothetical protein [Reyranella sp.]MBR2818233.1 hypothetical protein [Reyranella sp.]
MFTFNDIDMIHDMFEYVRDAHGVRSHTASDQKALNAIFDALRERLQRKTKLGRPRKQGGE